MSRKISFGKIIALCGSMAIAASAFPVTAAAEDADAGQSFFDEALEDKMASGSCGSGVTWTYSGKVLTISGSGRMSDLPVYDTPASPLCMPWYSYKNSIEKVIISEGVTSVGACAFYGCTAIRSVSIPSSVTYIGFGAFADCSSLQEVSVENGIIGESAFIRCTSLKKASIGPGVTNIGISAFENCNSLQGVYIKDTAAWCAVDFGGYLANPLEKARHLYLNNSLVTNLVIPDGVRSVGNYAFGYCTDITSVTVPASVESIGSYAFFMNENLTKVNIPSSGLKIIGNCAFSSCCRLTDFAILSTVESIGSFGFAYTPLQHVEVKKGRIGSYAFYKCGAIWDIILGDGVEYIGDMAFNGCAGLNTVKLGCNVSYIGKGAFAGCAKLPSEGHVDYSGTEDSRSRIKTGDDNAPLTSAKWNILGTGKTTSFYSPLQSVSFGRYEQDNNTGNGKEDIEWYVLDVQGDKALLVSKYVLDFKRYANNIEDPRITWQKSYLRSWLNSSFYNTAFSDTEKAALITTECAGESNPVYGTAGGGAVSDNVFILSASQAETYFKNDDERISGGTAYAQARNADPALMHPDYRSSYWWVRNPGILGYDTMYTHYSGYIVNDGMASSNVIGGVRPAVWVSCSAVGITEDKLPAFVERLYSTMLGRPSEAAGKADWVGKLKNGYTATEVSSGFVLSEELAQKNLSNTEFVSRMYRTFMNREPDAAGLADWVNALDSGCSYAFVLNSFVLSAEFGNICKEYGIETGRYEITEPRDVSRNLTAFTSRMYTKALGRAYEVDGLNYWTGRYINGEITLNAMAQGFIFSEEFTKKNLSDEQYVDTLYATFFDRPADAGGKSDWLNRMHTEGYSREDVLNGFLGAEEFGNLVKSFGL